MLIKEGFNMIDTKKIEAHIYGIIEALGDDPNREGLKETPKRVAKMYEEVFMGMNYTNEQIAKMFDKTFLLRYNKKYLNCDIKSVQRVIF